MNQQFTYPGKELELFSSAVNWKSYLRVLIAPYIRGRVLEVGAGIGAMTPYLVSAPEISHWALLEPDPSMASVLQNKLDSGVLPPVCEVIPGTIFNTGSGVFDTILYIDVLEHIAGDARELGIAADKLASGGKLIVLSPAFQFLYSPFDKAIGHYRRYTKKSLRAAVPPGLNEQVLQYADAAGLIASLANKLLLKQAYPSQQQVRFWDSWLVPVSRRLDIVLRYSFGKSIMGIWEKIPASSS